MALALKPSDEPVGYAAVVTGAVDLAAYLLAWKPELQLLVGAFTTAILAVLVHQVVTPTKNVPSVPPQIPAPPSPPEG